MGTPNPSQPASSTNFGPHIQAWASRSRPHSNLASAFSFSNSSPGQPQTLILSLSPPRAGITGVSHNTPSFFFVYFYFRVCLFSSSASIDLTKRAPRGEIPLCVCLFMLFSYMYVCGMLGCMCSHVWCDICVQMPMPLYVSAYGGPD